MLWISSEVLSGNVAVELLPSVKSILGVDVSENAVKKFNERFEEAGSLNVCNAVSMDIQADKAALEGKTFDVIYVSQRTPLGHERKLTKHSYSPVCLRLPSLRQPGRSDQAFGLITPSERYPRRH